MKIIPTFCLAKQILLNDILKLTKYLKLVYQTPVSYEEKSIRYFPINIKINKKRYISLFDFKDFTTYLSTINNYICNSKSPYPKNEQEFQDALRIIVEHGTFVQKFLTLQHIAIYFDSRITLYCQLATQLKDGLRDHQPKNTEETILKLFWEQIDIYDQEKIESLIEKQVEPQNPTMKIEERIKKEFLGLIDVLQVKCERYHLATQLNVEISKKKLQQIYYVEKQCQCKIEQNLFNLNNFHLVLYTHLLNLNSHEVNILSWDKIINELTIRDFTSMTVDDEFKIWLLLYEIGRQNSIVNDDKIIDKLMNQIELIQNKYYVLLCELLIETKNSKRVEFLKKWYPKIDLQNETSPNLCVILYAYNSAKLLNKLVLVKFLNALEEKMDQLEEIYIENILLSLVNHQQGHKQTFERAEQFELFENTSKNFLLGLLHYCQLYNQRHKKVREIQKVFVQQLKQENDESILIELLRILITGIRRKNNQHIEIISELNPFIKSFQNQKKEIQWVKNLNSKVYYKIMLHHLWRYTFNTSKALSLEQLTRWGLHNVSVVRNASTPELYEIAAMDPLSPDPETRPGSISSTGAMVAYSGRRTGRSPTDKRVVLDEQTEHEIWWGNVNIPIPKRSHNLLEQVALQFLNTRPRLFVVDGYAGWDPHSRLRIRVFCTRAYHALFMQNMLIKPTNEELKKDFSDDVDFHIFNAGPMSAPKLVEGVGSETCVSVNLTDKKMVILGTQYAGEMKKGVFGVTHYMFPKQGILTLHSSANEGVKGDVTLLFGLSGTGKTTLSADPKRKLIGDDEHGWSDNGIFNIEGGCYAKCVDLSYEKEPEIYNAIKFGAVLENVEFLSKDSREVDYHNISITENTRVSYPLDFIAGAKNPAVGGHPKNILFLTCDAYGVLPPVSLLTPEQAMYHFISGYTAKVAGTEMGVKEPVATFSACFGEAFLPLHPTLYATMLAEKMKEHGTKCWLVNTGWSGGKYGIGKRMSLKYTRTIIDAIHSGELANAEYDNFEIFNLQIPKRATGVPDNMLHPKNTWINKTEFDKTLRQLADKFQKNFKKYADKATSEVINAGPTI